FLEFPMSNKITQKVLIVTPTDLTKNSTGQLYITHLLQASSGIEFHTYRPSHFSGGFLSHYCPRVFRLIQLALRRCRTLRTIQFYMFNWFSRRRMKKEIIHMKRRLGADSIWVTASDIRLIEAAALLCKEGFEVRVTVWDAPEYLC